METENKKTLIISIAVFITGIIIGALVRVII